MAGDRGPGLRMVILSDRSPDEGRNGRERERFGAFVRALARGGIEAEHRFVPDEEGLRAALGEARPDLVFSASLLCASGPRGRASVHALLEAVGIPFVGSDSAALELAIGKSALKERWLREGVETPPFFRVGPGEDCGEADAARLGFPCIVKPDREGNSRGIGEDSVVRDPASLVAKARETVARFGSALVERFLGDAGDIREFTVAMLGSGEAALAMPAEITLSAPKAVRVITTEDKEGRGAAALPVADAALRDRVEIFARRAFAAAGVRDYSRCDLVMAGGRLQAIEINGQPMVPDPWFEACAAGAGLGEAAYLNAIVLAAIARGLREGRAGLRVPDAMRDIIPRGAYELLRGKAEAGR